MSAELNVFTLHDLLAHNLEARGDHPALELAGEAVSYAELGARVDRVAAWLEQQGVQAGQRVVVHLHKSVEEVVAIWAIARIGAVFVDVHYRWTLEQLGYVIEDAEAAALITDKRKLQALEKAGRPACLKHVLVKGSVPPGIEASAWKELPAAGPQGPGPVDRDLGALIYTSGSTGKPKGVMLTHLNLVEGARSVASYLGNRADDRLLAVLPFNFDAGFHQITTAFLVGATVLLCPAPMPAEVVRLAREGRATGIGAVPPVWTGVVRQLQESGEVLEGLRYVTNTGGAVPEPILDAWPQVFPGAELFLMYGLTEAFRSTFLPPGLFATKRGSIGRAIPNVEIHVVDGERLCGPDEVGELVHRGALISRGYWKRPDATAERIRPCPALAKRIGEELVCFSGDLVKRDADGILWFVGRRDGMLKVSGFRLSPTEVEEHAYASGSVGAAVAFGMPDDELGQVVHLVVTPRIEADAAPLEPAGLLEYFAKHAASYMQPACLHLHPGPMPLTASGKLDRPQIIAAAKAGELDGHLPNA